MSFRKIKNPETSGIYKLEAVDLALSWCPPIYPCKKCGHPVIEGYVCGTCDSDRPGSTEED